MDGGFWRRAPAVTATVVHAEYSGQLSTDKDQNLPSPQPTDQPCSPIKQEPVSEPLAPIPRTTDSLAQQRFDMLLSAPTIDLVQLQKLSWKGIPSQYRPTAWQLLMGYLPLSASRRTPTLQRKRKEYADWKQQTFARGDGALDKQLWHQIQIDVPRTSPGSPMFQNPLVQRSLERVLYCWAARHPASGYVQGINDLLTPFFFVFLKGAAITEAELEHVEADSFWCLTKLLDGIQDNYTHAQPGIQRQIVKLKELVMRIDRPLALHFESENIEFIQFAFRWINCLLMRELSLSSIVRMWDTYLAEQNGFSSFHIYVCAAFLLKWSKRLQQMDFQEIMEFLQRPPTLDWTAADVELLLSEAYMFKCLYHDAPHHLS
ncbi:GTPase-activating protein [Coemansia brasiliensis]|uniref:GTPase-activating protein n=1 Tax=Coemansia brasiliensis TaxID=2650707 RepID=A0A9W8I906_9FUNG|nr:GTPase-activating protein [Coemansia brasiliensis]